MAVVVSHAMRRYPASPPGSSYSSSHCLGGEGSYQDNWPREGINESSLSRSMRYAEPWLYGSVRAPGGLLLAPALMLCSCTEYLTGTKRSSKKGPTLCKKCKGTRFPLPATDTLRGTPKFGTVRCYPTTPAITATPHQIRSGTVRATSHSRPTILPSTDPYELMRRSRLSPENGTQFRIRSLSPSKSPNLLENALTQRSQNLPNSSATTNGRRSILECDINPYDLMALESEAKKEGSVTLVGGQRVRIRAPITEQVYEDVKVQPPRSTSQIPKPKLSSTNKTKGSPKFNEKESDSNRFKSILKKPTTFSDTDSSGGPERSPSPAQKSGSHFYLPLPMNAPRKKVQFLVENELVCHEQNDRKNITNTEKVVELKELKENTHQEEQNANIYEDVQEFSKEAPERKSFTLRRSVSERLLQEPATVVFNDTMALRTRSRRNDFREAFDTVTSLEKSNNVTAQEILQPPISPQLKEIEPIQEIPDEIKEAEKEEETGVGVVEERVDKPPTPPPRKKSNSKQPCIINIKPTPTLQETQKLRIESPEYPNKTVLQICSPPVPVPVHKIQIKNEFLEAPSALVIAVPSTTQRKTSIMINGDDCYSTINVNDDVPMYQSSVVVKAAGSDEMKPHRSSSVYITGNFVSTVPNANTEFVESTPKYSVISLVNPTNSEEINAEQLTKDHTESNLERANEQLNQLLNDPVEAVKRNLVPHVCGKSDVFRRPPGKALNSLAAALLQERLEPNVNKLMEDSLLKLRKYECLDDEKDSEHSSSTQYELMDPGSDCYTDNSNRSSLTEEELNARTKFYELLADSAIAELSENEDHHYESIRVNNSDPIYEEINPPPLPSNPPPSSIIDDLQLDKQFTTRSIFEGASKYDILSYLVDAKERGIVPEDSYNFGNSDVVIEEDVKESNEQYRVSHLSSVSDSSEDSSLVITNGLSDDNKTGQKSAEVERNDSGVGSETSKSSLTRFRTKSEPSLNCEDCEIVVEAISENEPLICKKCLKKRSERKEIITEIVETEEKYSRDLQIILEEFYQPMLVAGLLTPEQLSAIFLNVEELLENSQGLAERLRDAVEIATEQGDEDLLTVNIGKLFLEAAPMLHGFETYCIRQGTASLLLASLEKDKELLRIFLRVSQMENTMLRRMNLNSFLMVPVQRVTKYPLLLTRLYKATPLHHETRDQLKDAQHKIELHLNHMNSETKDVPSKLWRRIGSNSGRRSSTEMDLVSIKLRKIAVDVLEWNHDEAKFALEGKLLFTQPTDNNWRKGRTIKLAPINALLVTNGKQMYGNRLEEEGLCFPKTGIREAALLLVRDKNGRYSLLREPLYLDRCIIATDPAWQSYFEVQEVIGKDTFIFKAENDDLTRKWYRQLQYHAQGLGGWRKRRNALANIMINGMGLRS